MIVPQLSTRMKQGDNRLSHTVKGTQVTALETIEFGTGKAEVFALGLTAVFFRVDMINLVGEQPILLMNAAVFAVSPCPVSHFTA